MVPDVFALTLILHIDGFGIDLSSARYQIGTTGHIHLSAFHRCIITNGVGNTFHVYIGLSINRSASCHHIRSTGHIHIIPGNQLGIVSYHISGGYHLNIRCSMNVRTTSGHNIDVEFIIQNIGRANLINNFLIFFRDKIIHKKTSLSTALQGDDICIQRCTSGHNIDRAGHFNVRCSIQQRICTRHNVTKSLQGNGTCIGSNRCIFHNVDGTFHRHLISGFHLGLVVHQVHRSVHVHVRGGIQLRAFSRHHVGIALQVIQDSAFTH